MNPLLLTLTCPQVELCIETVLGRNIPRQSSKAVAIARLGREMRDRGLDAAEVMTAAGLLAPDTVDPEDDDHSYPGEAEAAGLGEENVPAIAPEPVSDPLAGLDHLLPATSAFVADVTATAPGAAPAPESEALAGKPLPKTGSKERTAYEMMTRPGGATNMELVAATGLRYSFAANGRRFAARYGLIFSACREGRTVRFLLTSPDAGPALAAAA